MLLCACTSSRRAFRFPASAFEAEQFTMSVAPAVQRSMEGAFGTQRSSQISTPILSSGKLSQEKSSLAPKGKRSPKSDTKTGDSKPGAK